MKLLKLIIIFISCAASAAAPQFNPTLWSTIPLSGDTYNANTTGTANVANYASTTASANTTAISDEIARAIGAESVLGNFTQSGTGAVSRSVTSKLNDTVSVLDFGAIPNDAGDDTSAIQAAITASSVVYIPPGNYVISNQLNITSASTIYGKGIASTYLSWVSPTLSVLSINTPLPVDISGINFNGPTTPTAGAVITITSSVTENANSYIHDNMFVNCWDCIDSVAASTMAIGSNTFARYQNNAILVQNTNNVDSGDSTIDNNVFTQAQGNSATGIMQYSSGGLRIIDNKINGGAYGYNMQLSAGVSTSDLLIAGNSCENTTIGCINLTTNGASASFSNIVITGNQVALTPAPINIAPAYYAFNYVAITGNVLASSYGGTQNIFVGNTENINIDGNTLLGSAAHGITPGSGIDKTNIGINNFSSGFTSKINGVANSGLHIADSATLTGSQSVTCAGAYGGFGLYYATATVTFVTPFDAPPTVVVATGTVGGGVSAQVVATTATGFTANIFSATSGCTGSFNWTAKGVI